MGLSVCKGRVVAFLGVILVVSMGSGCSDMGTSPSAAGPQMDELTRSSGVASPTEADISVVGAATESGSTRILAAASPEQLGLEMEERETYNRLLINTGSTEAQYKVSRLETPARLVIDILNQNSRLNRVFETPDAEFISSVRVGAHSDKSRVVLDLANYPDLAHHVDVDSGALIVTVAREANIEAAMNAPVGSTSVAVASAASIVDAEPSARQPEVTPPAVEVTAPAVESVELKLEEPTLAPAPVIEAEAETPRLSSLAIENIAPGENMLVANMQAAGFYTLQKTAPSEYVLTLEKADVDPLAQQPVIAAPGSGDIRSVRALKEGDNVLLRIFSDPQAELEARSMGGKIVVSRIAPAVAPEISEPRAQFDPNTTKGGSNNLKKEAEASGESQAAANAGGNNNLPSEGDVASLFADTPKYTGRLISLDLQDTDIDNALRIIAEVSNLNIIASDDVTGKVTLRLVDVPWDQALDVILKTNALDKVQEGNVVRIAPVEKLRQERETLKQAQQAEEELEQLQVRYLRVSYAKAAELQPLVEGVLTERGSVSYDERTNQLIIKDIARGIKNVAVLVSKVDLRTPQVLLETQIVEAQRNFSRDLGTELGFEYIQSPATGNATGSNFPNAISVGGSVTPGQIVGSSFPAAISDKAGSAVSFLLDSADGSQSLDMRITALEKEGRARVVSRPSVATTNNTQATIKSVEKIRVKTPSGGLSVATGSGASASGSAAVATEVIEIGILLEVTPQASPDYYVLLDINAKSSTLGSTIVEGIPSEIERSATSTVLVSSGQTFALGGIYKITDQDNVDGVPFFKDIPFLGHLFRRSFVNNKDEELIFFITPRIIEGSFDDATMRVSS